MTSTQIRQSFLDFFKSKQHTIVPSSSLMPDSPNLLFTNAGMNQFVPIFLGQTKCPYTPGRAADTQKCIRAGGKHNDLDDVGLDTYHHTFFEMLGNWSFGDYFKKEAIDWAWELVVGIWKFPPQRLYATVYNPDKSKNDPSEFDQEAWNFWAEKFRSVGLDPAVHIVNGNKKDNFWMMGETGPCGPCSELHVDLTPTGDTKGALVNKGDARCIEIWNLVFIQFNANPDGTFSPLPAKHVDTGMGFERVTSIIQGTKGFTDFANAKISNYETDIFRPIFDAIEKLSGKKYGSTLPKPGSTGDTEQEKIDVAFRVIGDHIRTLSFAIADGIQPGIKGRNGVLRSIHKRMVRYASTIDVKDEILLRTQDTLVDTLAVTMGDVFQEVRVQAKHVKEVLRQETDVFNKTLGDGLKLFENRLTAQSQVSSLRGRVAKLKSYLVAQKPKEIPFNTYGEEVVAITNWVNRLNPQSWVTVCSDAEKALIENAQKLPNLLGGFYSFEHPLGLDVDRQAFVEALAAIDRGFAFLEGRQLVLWANSAFVLADTYGFPLDLTELMARERGLTVDKDGFNKLLDDQKKRSQAAQKKEVISLSQIETTTPTKFAGYEHCEGAFANVLEVVDLKGKAAIILDSTPFYAEMGGQVGDTGALGIGGDFFEVASTTKSGNAILHVLKDTETGREIPRNEKVRAFVDYKRRFAIERHHTVTHLLHWALHEVVSKEASQKGSFVGPDKLTFDFNSAPLTPAQVADIEKLVNERIVENAGVSWTEVPYADVKSRKDVMQFFGDKYGDSVRVVQIGGHAQKLDGYSMELCGGTHTRATGEIGLFRIVSENAIAAGVRRIEAVAGLEAYGLANDQLRLLRSVASQLNAPVTDLEKKVEALLARQKELEREVRTAMMRNASNAASELLGRVHTVNGIPFIAHNLGEADPDFLQAIADALKGRFQGVVVLGGHKVGAVTLVCVVTPDFTSKVQAGKIIQTIAPIVGGKGGGKPDNARGGGKDASKLDEALAKAKSLM